MKKLFIILFLLSFTEFSVFATCYRVLFLGNSYTSVNNLPQLVYDVSVSAGDTIIWQSNTPGGCTFQQHLTISAPLIQQGGWDFVVLQEQSELPSFPIDQFMQDSYPYAQQLCQMIAQYNPQATVVFFMTWGRKNGDAQNAQYFPVLSTYEGMDSLLHARYMMMAEDNNAIVSPVGALWHYIRNHYPDIELYSADDSHPSLIGSYAAACCFYTVLFQHSPLNITTDCGVDTQIAPIIRQSAQQVVYDSLAHWLFLPTNDTTNTEDTTNTTDTVGITIDNLLDFSLYPNPASDFINIDLNCSSNRIYHLYIYDVQGLLLMQFSHLTQSPFLIDISQLSPGMYILKTETYDNKVGFRKFIRSNL